MIEVYTKDNCMQCQKTKKWLDDHHVDYIEKNTDKYPEYMNYVGWLGAIKKLPLVMLPDRTYWLGYDEEYLEELLN